MFATRRDQENLTHLHSQAASVKPLNQSNLKTPGPKANAPKTPFRNRHDENTTFATGKAAGGKVALFTTPATTKPRPVLGNKTTNAKAQPTPGLGGLKTATKPTAAPPPSAQKISPRLRRGKVRIHQTTVEASPIATQSDGEDSAPEIEYCPPPSKRTPPLPDHPDDFHEWFAANKQAFDSKNYSTHVTPHWPVEEPDENGMTSGLRKQFAEINAARKKAIEAYDETSMLADLQLDSRTAAPSSKDRPPKHSAQVSVDTIRARGAAAALSGESRVPSFAAPTKATKARVEASLVGVGKENDPASSRFVSAKAASKSTLGYAKGRQVSATKRAPLSAAHRAPVVKGRGDLKQSRAVEPRVRGRSQEQLEEDEEIRRMEAQFNRMAMDEFVLEL